MDIFFFTFKISLFDLLLKEYTHWTAIVPHSILRWSTASPVKFQPSACYTGVFSSPDLPLDLIHKVLFNSGVLLGKYAILLVLIL